MSRNEAVFQAIYTGDKNAAVAAVEQALDAGAPVDQLMNESLITAMKKIGDDFENGSVFVPEMLLSARAMDAALELMKPLLEAAGTEPKGRVCIGTVRGDLHDIGKNLVVMTLRGAGYEVEDLGVDCTEAVYAEAVQRGAQVVCLSALLTTTMPVMQDIISHLRSSGIDIPVVIGGSPVTRQYAQDIGAQGYSDTASGAVGVVADCLSKPQP